MTKSQIFIYSAIVLIGTAISLFKLLSINNRYPIRNKTAIDNGKGLPEDFDIENAEGIGFEIIRALCRQISAKLAYESNNYGTQFNLIFENKA